MKELGESRKIMGIEITRNKQQRRRTLSQRTYLEKLIRKINMTKAKVVNVPFAQHFKLSSEQSPIDEGNIEEMKYIPFSSALGSLMYNMVCTRPDLVLLVDLWQT